MALSDCSRCWETPCSCGFDYRWWPVAKREELAAAILGIPFAQLKACGITPERHPKADNERWDCLIAEPAESEVHAQLMDDWLDSSAVTVDGIEFVAIGIDYTGGMDEMGLRSGGQERVWAATERIALALGGKVDIDLRERVREYKSEEPR